MIRLALPDVIVIGLYFAAVLFVGYRTVRRASADEEDFLLAGRSLTLPVFVMTLVSTWYGGILGVGEFSYRYGISNWVIQGAPYYLFAALFAMFFAKRIRASNLTSIPDKLQQSYGANSALLGAGLTFVLMTPAPYVLMLSLFLQMLFGWNLLVSLLVVSVTAVSYLFWGGFRADVETDMVEFVLMFLGFAVILPFAYWKFGGREFLEANLPALHTTWHGGNSWQFILTWFFIALWTLVDPAFHQRCNAARSGEVARRGIFVSIGFWFLFDLMTACAGLYARAALPDLPDPMMAYPMLAEAVLPPVAKGLFYVGMLATIMSTLNTLAFVSAQTLGRDLYLRWKSARSGAVYTGSFSRHPEVHGKTIRAVKLSLILSFVLSIGIAFWLPSVIRIWYTIGTIVIPGLLVPLVAGYFDALRISARYAFAAMLGGWLTSLAWLLSAYLSADGNTYLLGVEPMYPGLLVSIACWTLGKLDGRLPSSGEGTS